MIPEKVLSLHAAVPWVILKSSKNSLLARDILLCLIQNCIRFDSSLSLACRINLDKTDFGAWFWFDDSTRRLAPHLDLLWIQTTKLTTEPALDVKLCVLGCFLLLHSLHWTSFLQLGDCMLHSIGSKYFSLWGRLLLHPEICSESSDTSFGDVVCCEVVNVCLGRLSLSGCPGCYQVLLKPVFSWQRQAILNYLLRDVPPFLSPNPISGAKLGSLSVLAWSQKNFAKKEEGG